MNRKSVLLIVFLAVSLGYFLGIATASVAVLSSYMSPNNPASPKVSVYCEGGDANVKFEVTNESSLNWYTFNRLFSHGSTSHSQSPLSVTSITIHPTQPGIYTMVVRQIVDFDKESFPEDGRIMAFRVITVPVCGK